MAKPLTLWRTWEDSDMAQTDCYFPTKQQALSQLATDYGVKPSELKPMDDDPDTWQATIEEDSPLRGSYAYLERIHVTPTRDGICRALANIPHR